MITGPRLIWGADPAFAGSEVVAWSQVEGSSVVYAVGQNDDDPDWSICQVYNADQPVAHQDFLCDPNGGKAKAWAEGFEAALRLV